MAELTRSRAALVALTYALLLAYLSFIPFRYQAVDLDLALALFAQTPWLDLGPDRRADWAANLLMYLPLGAVLAGLVVPHPRRRFEPLAVAVATVFGGAWGVAVEFGQIFFSGRTVSLNDIVAEVLGALLGAWIWSAFGASGREWWRRFARGGAATARAALGGYVLAYLVLSFSPFDFLLSFREIAEKAASPLYGLWIAPVSCGPSPCSVKLLAELCAVVPFGWWWAMHRRSVSGGVLSAALAGIAIGGLLEFGQFFLVSGTSQGASVLARAAGMALGAGLHANGARIVAVDWARFGRPLVLAAVLPYLAAVAYVGGWFSGRWLGVADGLARVDEVQWLPFFYQYFSTEQALIRSTVVHLILYAPIGVAVWLWRQGGDKASAGTAALMAMGLATVAESGKLFIAGKHPDYTDVLIAALTAGATAAVLRWASSRFSTAAHVAADTAGTAITQVAGRSAPAAELQLGTALLPARALGVALMLIALASLWCFPFARLALLAGFLVYAAALVRWPTAYLVAVPVALPVFDLAPFSGRFFWDELDLLLAVTLGVRLLMRLPARRTSVPLPKGPLWLLALSVLASTVVGMWPPAPLDANAFSSYLSPYNALRLAKGYLWAGVILWLVARDAGGGAPTGRRLMLGLTLGLLATGLSVCWERAQFVGLLDLSSYFRAAGFVAATHVGGAYLEAMLVALTPFAQAQALGRRGPAATAFGYAVAALGAIAVLMTLSRAAFAAWLLSVVVVLLMTLARQRAGRANLATWARRAAAVGTMLSLIALAVLAAQTTLLGDRLAASQSDLAHRVSHWRASFDLMRWDPLHAVLGLGLGSFPREFYVAHAVAAQLPAYRVDSDRQRDRSYLALTGGRGLYVDQRVDRTGTGALLLRGEIRATGTEARLHAGLCEKSLLNALDCRLAEVKADSQWRPFEATLAAPRGPTRAPISLTLHNGAFGSRIEVTSLSLQHAGRELLANGSFARGLDRWFFYSDVHLAWRAHSTPLQVLLEQGVLGVAAWIGLAIGVAGAAVRTRAADTMPAAAAAALGFIAVGIFDTLLDAPRLVLLAALILAAATAVGGRAEGRHGDGKLAQALPAA